MKKARNAMPSVSGCLVEKCSYNVNKTCHARAITVGDSIIPHCDTYLDGDRHVMNTKLVAGVGACKVASCRFNNDFECIADHIRVGLATDRTARCLSFQQR